MVKAYLSKIRKTPVGSSSATISFFVLISFLPICLLIIKIGNYLDIDYLQIINDATKAFPIEVQDFIRYIFSNLHYVSVYGMIPLVIVPIWGATRIMVELERVGSYIFLDKFTLPTLKRRIEVFLVLLTCVAIGIVIIFLNIKYLYLILIYLCLVVINRFTLPSIVNNKIVIGSSFVMMGIFYLFTLIIIFVFKNFTNYHLLYGSFAFLIVTLYFIYTFFKLYVYILVFIDIYFEKCIKKKKR